VIDIEAIVDEANDIATDQEAVGAEAIEITADVFKEHLKSHLRSKYLEYEAKGNHVSAMTMTALLQELN
jgi:hypothetical protein